MKVGQRVNYYSPADGIRKDAEVLEIQGAGPSLGKILKLGMTIDGEEVEVEGIPHLPDAEPGEPFWLLKGRSAPRGWADTEDLEQQDED